MRNLNRMVVSACARRALYPPITERQPIFGHESERHRPGIRLNRILNTARFAQQLGSDVGLISGHHAPYLQQPEAFAEELRPILRELS